MKSKLIAALIMFSLLALPLTALAHPGRTDKYGGHTCKTNCTKWGYKYGQYHYHRRK